MDQLIRHLSPQECYSVAGTVATAGLSPFAALPPASASCPAVSLLERLGAVPFCKTNVPQGMFSLQCSNPLYGVSSNPHMPGRECGGSSGGEGALVGGGGSPLGLGSDIGGSLRCPPAFCGAWSLKPTWGRHISQLGTAPAFDGEAPLGIPVTGGFIAGSPAGVAAGMRAVWSTGPGAEPGLVPLPWQEEVYQARPKLGYFTEDGWMRPAPGCSRAVRVAVARLEAAGWECVPVSAPPIQQCLDVFNGLVLGDEIAWLRQALDYDQSDTACRGILAALAVYRLPRLLKLVLEPLITLVTGVPPLKALYTRTEEAMVGLVKRDEITRNYLTTLDKAGVGALICPASLFPAPPTGLLGTLVVGITPYIPWNVMNCPAGIGPVTCWTAEDEAQMEHYPRDNLACLGIHEACKDSVGLPLAVQVRMNNTGGASKNLSNPSQPCIRCPCGVLTSVTLQVVARPYRDEHVLRVLSELADQAGPVGS